MKILPKYLPLIFLFSCMAQANAEAVNDLPHREKQASAQGINLKAPMVDKSQSEAPYLDPDFEQVIVFVVKPTSRNCRCLTLVPINHDLLQSFADNNGYELKKYPELALGDTKVKTLIDIQRFNNPLKIRPLQKYRLKTDPSEKELKIPPPSDPFLIWESGDGKKLSAKLRTLLDESIFWTLPKVQVNASMLTQATKRAHFDKVPTRSNPYEANPGNAEPDISGFYSSNRNTTSH